MRWYCSNRTIVGLKLGTLATSATGKAGSNRTIVGLKLALKLPPC